MEAIVETKSSHKGYFLPLDSSVGKIFDCWQFAEVASGCGAMVLYVEEEWGD